MTDIEYWRTLIRLTIAPRRGMDKWHALNRLLLKNGRKSGIFRMPTEIIQHIRVLKDQIRRQNNREVYRQDPAHMYHYYVEWTDAKGWHNFRQMTGHDNVPGERTE
jgi:hypothetical protein